MILYYLYTIKMFKYVKHVINNHINSVVKTMIRMIKSTTADLMRKYTIYMTNKQWT